MQQQFAQTNVPDEQWDLVCLFLWYWITTSICHCSCGFGADGANKDQRPNVLHMSRWPPVLWAQPQHLGKYTWFRVASGFTKFGLKLLFKTLFDRLFLHFYNSGLCFKIRVIPQPKHASLIPDHSLTKKNPKQNKKNYIDYTYVVKVPRNWIILFRTTFPSVHLGRCASADGFI